MRLTVCATIISVCLPYAAAAQQDALAPAPALVWPVDCTLGSDCWIARYLDRGEGDSMTDYACGKRSQDNHKGTDISLADLGQMRRGTAVLAAAPGIIAGRRDGMPDRQLATQADRERIRGRECGNGVLIRHEGGWETQYCHMAEGSVRHQQGDRVAAGETLGAIGMSGESEYPHLHFQLKRRDSEGSVLEIDPFDGGEFEQGCIGPGDEASYWVEKVTYAPAVLLPPRLVEDELTRATMWQPQAIKLNRSGTKLLLQARAFHTKAGDALRFTLVEPDGRVRLDRTMTLDRGFQVARPFVGIRRPAGGFAPGVWRGTVELVRGGASIGAASVETRID